MGKIKKSRFIQLIAILLAAVLVLCTLTGCRDSSAFTQVVYNQNSETETDDDEMMDNDEENIEYPDDDVFSVTESDDAESTRDYSDDVAQSGDGTTGTSRNVVYDASASDFYTSSNSRDSSSSSDEDGADSTEGDSQSESDEEGDYGTDGEEEETGSGSSSSEIDDTTSSSTGSSGDGDYTGSSSGTYTSSGSGTTVAAIGDIAVMALMLGAELVATSDSFKTASVGSLSAYSVFSNSSLISLSDSLVYLGNIDSFSDISSSNFEKLIDAAPSAVLLAADDSFTSSQKSQLTSANIEIIYLADMTYHDSSGTSNVDYNLEVIAQYLDTSYASEVLETYETWCDNIETLSGKGSSGLYTCYIDAWDSDVVGTFNYDRKKYTTDISSSESYDDGMAVVTVYRYLNISYYLNKANITATNSVTYNSASDTTVKYFYVHTILGNAITRSVSGNRDENIKFRDSGLQDGSQNDAAFTYAYSADAYLGSSSFPVLLVSSQYIQDKIEYSRDNSGLYSGALTEEWFGFTTGSQISAIDSTDYDVYVVPYGVCSWADGSVESPLLSLWAAYVFNSSLNYESTVKAQIKYFYTTFYGYSLSDSDVNKILAGLEE